MLNLRGGNSISVSPVMTTLVEVDCVCTCLNLSIYPGNKKKRIKHRILFTNLLIVWLCINGRLSVEMLLIEPVLPHGAAQPVHRLLRFNILNDEFTIMAHIN